MGKTRNNSSDFGHFPGLYCWFCILGLLGTSVNAAENSYPEQSMKPQKLELDELLKMDLRELTNIEVSLASRVEEKQFSAPGAVYVLTQEDIHRSGHRRLPEILRLVPGLHVAKIDQNKWSVSIRNSQTRFSSVNVSS